MSNNAKDGVITLGGHEFKRVKNGLDEIQVASFIDELIKERDTLAQSQDHVASLTRLAETTIVEADKLARQIKTEATEKAEAESAAIIDRAREQAQLIAEKKQAEAMEIANEKAHAIQSEAAKKAALLLENERKKIQDELRNLINQQFGHLLEELESLKQQAAAAQADFDNKLSQPMEESGAIILKFKEESGAIILKSEEETGAISMESEEESGPATMEIEEDSGVVTTAIKDESGAATMETEAELNAVTIKEDKIFDESPELIRDTGQTGESFDLSKLLQMEDRAELGEPQFEVEILPPVYMAKIMEVVAYLDQLREVENTEIIPRMDMPSILVFLREQMNFVDVLRTIPAVAYVEEVTIDENASNGEPRKVRIGLSGNIMSQ